MLILIDWVIEKTLGLISLSNAPKIIEVSPNIILQPKQEESLLSTWQVIMSLNSFLFSKKNLPEISSAAILTGIGTGLNFLSPYLFSEMLNLLTHEEENIVISGIELSRSSLIMLLIISYTLSQVVPNVRDQIMLSVTTRNTKNMNECTNAHLLNKSLNYHIHTSFSDQFYLVQKSTSVSLTGSILLTRIAPTVMEITIACMVLSNQYGEEISFGLLGLLILLASYSALTAKSIIDAREASLQSGNEAYDEFYSAITQYKSMRDYGKFDETMKVLKQKLNNMANDDFLAASKPLQIGFGHILIVRFGMLLASLYSGSLVKSGKYNTQDFLVLIGYFSQLSNLLPAFGHGINQLVSSYPDLKFVFSELAKPDEVVDLYPDRSLPITLGVAPSIEFDNVTFSYDNKITGKKDQLLFENLSFKIMPGEKVVFISESGAGKTTIFNLLYGYYVPTRGVIRINGENISQISLNSLQENITLFGQNPNLFKGTIRENIIYGAKKTAKIEDKMIWVAANALNLSDFLLSFPQKLNTEVGEGGKKLSGGEQQKVAILRSLIKSCSIHLLDEVTAALDNQSSAKMLHGLLNISEGVTSLMITHNLKEAQYFDRILVLDKGKITSQGTHSFLLETCDLYQKLWTACNRKNPATPCLSVPGKNNGFFSSSQVDSNKVMSMGSGLKRSSSCSF